VLRLDDLRKRAGARDGDERRRSGEAGFTLVELLVVLAILGMLVAIATPQVLKYLGNARVETTRVQIHNLSTALDFFKLDVGRYPTTAEGLDALMVAPPGVENWNGPYLKQGASLKDPWGHPYAYASPGEHSDFDLSSAGPDGDPHGSHVIANW
jgi:general secretion pathway protein G